MDFSYLFSSKVDKRKTVGHLFSYLKADRNITFQSLYEGTITSLEIDTVENKYILCGTSAGVVAVYEGDKFVGKHELSPVAHIGKSNSSCPDNIRNVSWYSLHTALFATSGEDGYVIIWDTNYLKPLDKYHLKSVIRHHAFGTLKKSSSLIATVGDFYAVRVIDFRVGSSSHALSLGDTYGVSVAWSPINENICCSGHRNGSAYIWDIRMCKKPLEYLSRFPRDRGKRKAHSGPVVEIHFADDNLSLVTLGYEGYLRLWDVRTGNFEFNIARLTTSLYQYLHHVKISSIASHSTPPICIFPDGKYIRVVSIYNGSSLNRLGGHFDQITALDVFRDDSFRVVSAGYDQSILMWSIQPAK